jgi:hypothetical protein
MAVITVSKIQVRSGLQEDLPALDTGEFGWCVDTQRLFIGKGTLAEGAPETGVTEILTEYSAGLLSVSIDLVNANIANVNATLANILPITSNLTPTTTQLLDNVPTLSNIAAVTIESTASQFINYNITRDTTVRSGTIKVSNYLGTVVYDDEYSETADTGVTLYFTGNTVTNVAVLGYTTTSTGIAGNLTYSYINIRTVTS